MGSNGGTPETRAVVDAADLIVFVGCRRLGHHRARRHPQAGKARIIHIDVDPAVPGTNYKVDVPLVGDARLCLSALIDALDGYKREADLSFVDQHKRTKFEKFEALARSDDQPISPSGSCSSCRETSIAMRLVA